VRITWQVANAVRIELSDARQTQVLSGESGELGLYVDADMEISLSAYDDHGLIVTRKIKIDVAEPPAPPEATGPTTTGGATGGR
jgi:hypothetical protein